MSNTKLLYEVDELPIFQNRMYDSKKEAIGCPKGSMRLVEHLDTGLIYNDAFSPGLMVYDGKYQNEQAVSPLFQSHLEAVSLVIARSMGKANLVEVGCGKGYFLEMLLTDGFDINGFDPTYEGVNPRVKRQYFTSNIIDKANGLILRHVLEHIQNPVAFLEQLKAANGGSGKIYIEVPCFDWIAKHRAWFDIFYEHVNYFRISDFKRMFDEVIEIGRAFGGQYLYVIAELSSLRKPVIDSSDRVDFPSDFTVNVTTCRKTSRSKTVIWGGASKGVIFALLRERSGHPVDIVIDINPAKQGRFLPGTGLQVFSLQQGLSSLEIGQTIYVMNSNYIEEIRQMSSYAFNYIGVDHE